MRTSIVTVALLLGLSAPSFAYIEAPMTLGDVITQSNMITILRQERRQVEEPDCVRQVEDIRAKFRRRLPAMLSPGN